MVNINSAELIHFLILQKQVLEETNFGNMVITGLISLGIYLLSDLCSRLIGKIIEKRKAKVEENKEIAETKNMNSQSRKADAETITEKNEADKVYVETARGLIDDMKSIFEARVIAMEERQKNQLDEVIRKQKETDAQLAIIREENEAIKIENKKIKTESLELHQENVKLVSTITKLQSAIKGLKKLIEKLLGGINKLISTYETNHKDEVIPWKPILTDEEQLLFQSDFDDLSNHSYR